jgi:hypothetical protein
MITILTTLATPSFYVFELESLHIAYLWSSLKSGLKIPLLVESAKYFLANLFTYLKPSYHLFSTFAFTSYTIIFS